MGVKNRLSERRAIMNAGEMPAELPLHVVVGLVTLATGDP